MRSRRGSAVGTVIVILALLVGSYLCLDKVHNAASRWMCDGGTVSYKEAYNNYHPGWFNKFRDSSTGRSEMDPEMYVLHVDDGRFLCGSDHDFAVDKATYDSVEIGDIYNR